MGKLGTFAQTGQGLGSRAKKGNVAQGGRANADDQKNKVDFTSGKLTSPAGSKSSPRMDQKPATTKNSSKGVTSPLKLGQASQTNTLSPKTLKNSSKGAKSPLALGQGEQTKPIASSLKNSK
jgi:hypothetical protein